MRYLLLFLVLAAALVIVACSGTTLFFTAFNSAKEPWQQWLQGSGMAAVVAWEAGAILVIGLCFKARYWVTGIGAMILLVLAMAVTTRQDLRLYVGGQADVTASKSVVADDRNRVRAELDRAYSRRDTLLGLDRLTKLQTAELGDVRLRIKDLEKRWDTRTENVSSSGNAEGELAYLLFGAPVALSQTLLDTVNMWFWMFARVFSIPAAAVAIQALWAGRKPRTAAKAPEGRDIQSPLSTALVSRPMPLPRAELKPRLDLTRKLGNSSEIPNGSPTDDTPPADAKPVVEEQEAPVEKVAAKLELVTDGGKSVQKSPEPEKFAENVAQKVVDFPVKVKRAKYRKVAPNKHGKVGRVVDWLGETATQTPDAKVRVSSEDCYGNYEIWCDGHGLYAVPWRTFTKKLTAQLRIKNPERNSKNGQRMFPLLLTDPSQWQQKRKVRAA